MGMRKQSEKGGGRICMKIKSYCAGRTRMKKNII